MIVKLNFYTISYHNNNLFSCSSRILIRKLRQWTWSTINVIYTHWRAVWAQFRFVRKLNNSLKVCFELLCYFATYNDYLLSILSRSSEDESTDESHHRRSPRVRVINNGSRSAFRQGSRSHHWQIGESRWTAPQGRF